VLSKEVRTPPTKAHLEPVDGASSLEQRMCATRENGRRRRWRGVNVANPKKQEMPGGKMVEPPKGKKKSPPGDMPSGEMQAPPPAKAGRKK